MEMQGGAYGIYEDEIEPVLARIRRHDGLEAIESTPCPCCGGRLRVWFYPEGQHFQLGCDGVPPHFSMLQSIDEPPPWWGERICEPVESMVSEFTE